jgi:tRNA (adenine-N(1)-)-methyltransferase non-catalytic subunit
MEVNKATWAAGPDVAKEGDWALIVDNEIRYSFAVVAKEATVRLGKKACSCAAFIGATYGSYFEAVNGKLFLTEPWSAQEALQDLLGDETSGTAAPDNRDLHDRNQAQTLTQDDINTFKEEGKKSELVRALATNSSTFTKRTEYSQEKYIRKKTQKHQIIVQLVRPTSALICRAYFHKKAFRIQNMRPDTLAHITTLANFQSGLRSLIIDDLIGLVVGTALERAGGRGSVYNLHQGGDTNPSALRLFNLTPDQLKPLKHVPIKLMRGEWTAQTFKVEETEDTSNQDDNDDENGMEGVEEMEGSGSSKKSQGDKAKKLAKRINPEDLPPKRKKKDHIPLSKVLAQEAAEGVTPEESMERRRKNNEMRKLYRELKWQTLCDYKSELESAGVDSLVIAGPPHPLGALNSTWRFLNLSGHFVIYGEFMQPLVECYQALFSSGCVVNLRLTETWHRNYQVLPKRTHPLMNMSAASGFILSGIKCEPVINRNTTPSTPSAGFTGPTASSSEASSSNSGSAPPAKKAKLAEETQ